MHYFIIQEILLFLLTYKYLFSILSIEKLIHGIESDNYLFGAKLLICEVW